MRTLLCILLAGSCATTAVSDTSAVAKDFLAAVTAFQATLADAQQAALAQPFDSEARMSWSYLPGERVGVTLGSLDEGQKAALQAVVTAGLSAAGFAKAEAIRGLEEVLGGSYNPGNYYLALFGTPSETAPWALRWEGHHLSLNWTMVDGKVIASTPQFFGANPAIVKEGPRAGTQVLKVEEELARALVTSLDEAQHAKAVQGETAPPEILTGRQREAAILENSGIAFRE